LLFQLKVMENPIDIVKPKNKKRSFLKMAEQLELDSHLWVFKLNERNTQVKVKSKPIYSSKKTTEAKKTKTKGKAKKKTTEEDTSTNCEASEISNANKNPEDVEKSNEKLNETI
jgi:hypothetical protein